MNKISICTVCMNRLTYLRQTLPQNIANNRHYPYIEFVLLDYNSRDGLENWVKEELTEHIQSGVLKYYKTYDPEYFLLSHSKNMALKLATGDVICMVDADNYAGPGYVDWINDVFEQYGPNTVITTLRKDHIPYRDQGGKLCFKADSFRSSRGFDESLIGYGVEDVDLVNRLDKSGARRVFIEQEHFLSYIGHSNEERIANFYLTNNIQRIFTILPKDSNNKNRILYLLSDGSFLEVIFEFDETQTDNFVTSYGGWSVAKDSHRKGNFQRIKQGTTAKEEDRYNIYFEEGHSEELVWKGNDDPLSWKRITTDDVFYYIAIKGYGECINRIKFLENDKNCAAVNEHGWGEGTVFLNFDTTFPIKVS